MVTQQVESVAVQPLNLRHMEVGIRGIAPYMQARFSEKAMLKMRSNQAAGSQARSKRQRDARDFDADYIGAMHLDLDDRHGIPASAFRNAMISACRTVGYKMTIAKLSVFVEADSFDKVDGTPLVFIDGEPERTEMPVRNATGVVDIRVRPMWREWSANLRITWDADQFSQSDVLNLLTRAGMQVGIGEGRPDSKSSAGLGFGRFEVL